MHRVRRGLATVTVLVALGLPPSGRPAAASATPPGTDSATADLAASELTAVDGTLERGALIAAVLERNPSLGAARAALEAARARADEARGLPDAMGRYGVAPLAPFDDEARFGHVIEVGQELPWPGTLAKRGERAAELADVVGADLEALAHELALMASQLYDEYQYLGRALAINAEHLELLREFQEVATARYAAGVAPQQAPLAAEVERAHVEHRQVVLTADRAAVVARLNALLHRPATAELPRPPAELEDPTLVETPPTDPEGLIELAIARRPETEAARSSMAARETGLELARLAGRPDFRPMTSYNSMWGMESHRWMVGLGLSLPVWRDRVQAGVAAAEAELRAATQRLLAVQDRIGSEVQTALDRSEESRHVVTLFASRLLPASRDQLAAARSAFETGQVDFLAVIDAERRLRDTELGLAQAQAQYRQRLAQLQRAVGTPPGGPWPPTAPPRSPKPDAARSASASKLPGAGSPGRTP